MGGDEYTSTQWFYKIVGGAIFMEDRIHEDSVIADTEEKALEIIMRGYNRDDPKKFKLLHSREITLRRTGPVPIPEYDRYGAFKNRD